MVGLEANTDLLLLDLLVNFTCAENNRVACFEYDDRPLDLLNTVEDVRTSCRNMSEITKRKKQF